MAGAILFNGVNLKLYKIILAIKRIKKVNRPMRVIEISTKKICEFKCFKNITQCFMWEIVFCTLG